jgi:hypothetical protein
MARVYPCLGARSALVPARAVARASRPNFGYGAGSGSAARQSSHSPVSTTAAVVVASCVVSRELVAIAYVRKRFMAVSWRASLLQVTGGGARVTAVGFLIGNA